jgi:hypothetical protein
MGCVKGVLVSAFLCISYVDTDLFLDIPLFKTAFSLSPKPSFLSSSSSAGSSPEVMAGRTGAAAMGSG